MRLSIVLLLLMSISLVQSANARNLLCDSTTWDALDGEWSQNNTDCSLLNTHHSMHMDIDSIRFRSFQPFRLPNHYYSDSNNESASERLTFLFQIHSGNQLEFILILADSTHSLLLHPMHHEVIFGSSRMTSPQIRLNSTINMTLFIFPSGTAAIYLNQQYILNDLNHLKIPKRLQDTAIIFRAMNSTLTMHSVTHIRDKHSSDILKTNTLTSMQTIRKLLTSDDANTSITSIPRSIFVGPTKLSFADAEAYCSGYGRHLVSIHSVTENHRAALLCESISANSSDGCFIGLEDFFGEWKWNDGTENDYGFDNHSLPTIGAIPWASGHPNVSIDTGNDGCVYYSSDRNYRWSTTQCDEYNYPICSGDGTRDVLYSDTTAISPSENKTITYIDIGDEMHFEWSITINSFPSGWANVFHCGSTDDVRMPSIYIHPNSDDEGAAWEGFLVFWSTINDKNNYINPGPHLQVNTTYDVQLDITQNRWKLTINGEVIHDGDKEEHESVQTVPCYASNPFSAVADVEIRDILITTTAVDMSVEPTIEVTSPPTPFPTAVSPQSVTNETEENTSFIRDMFQSSNTFSIIAVAISIVATCLLCIVLICCLRERRRYRKDEQMVARLQSETESGSKSSKRKETSSTIHSQSTRLRYPSVFQMMSPYSDEANTAKMLMNVHSLSAPTHLVARSSGASGTGTGTGSVLGTGIEIGTALSVQPSLIEEDEQIQVNEAQPQIRISIPPVQNNDEFHDEIASQMATQMASQIVSQQFESCRLIMEILKEVAPQQWQYYLNRFTREKWTDKTLRNIPCDLTKDDEPFWKKLMDEDGVRAMFKLKWSAATNPDLRAFAQTLAVNPVHRGIEMMPKHHPCDHVNIKINDNVDEKKVEYLHKIRIDKVDYQYSHSTPSPTHMSSRNIPGTFAHRNRYPVSPTNVTTIGIDLSEGPRDDDDTRAILVDRAAAAAEYAKSMDGMDEDFKEEEELKQSEMVTLQISEDDEQVSPFESVEEKEKSIDSVHRAYANVDYSPLSHSDGDIYHEPSAHKVTPKGPKLQLARSLKSNGNMKSYRTKSGRNVLIAISENKEEEHYNDSPKSPSESENYLYNKPGLPKVTRGGPKSSQKSMVNPLQLDLDPIPSASNDDDDGGSGKLSSSGLNSEALKSAVSAKTPSPNANEDEKWEEADDEMLRTILDDQDLDITVSVTANTPNMSPNSPDSPSAHSYLYGKPGLPKVTSGGPEEEMNIVVDKEERQKTISVVKAVKHASGKSESYELHSYSGDDLYHEPPEKGITPGNLSPSVRDVGDDNALCGKHEEQQSESYELHSYSGGDLYRKGKRNVPHRMDMDVDDAAVGTVHAMKKSDSFELHSYSGFDLYGPGGDQNPQSPYKE